MVDSPGVQHADSGIPATSIQTAVRFPESQRVLVVRQSRPFGAVNIDYHEVNPVLGVQLGDDLGELGEACGVGLALGAGASVCFLVS